MKFNYACRVTIGTRETNDDRALVDGQIINDAQCSGCITSPAVAVVCDGCGGYTGGGTAAETVLGSLAAEDPSLLLNPAALTATLKLANERLEKLKKAKPELREMCTTVVGIVSGDSETTVFHLGDSRLYRYDGYTLAQLTSDHSAVQHMVDMGLITREEARTHPNRNRIEGCMGRELRPPEIQPGLSPAYPGDVYLLCSDGLWEAVTDKDIRDILSSGDSVQSMAQKLVFLASANGSDDNITALVLSCEGKTTAAAPGAAYILD